MKITKTGKLFFSIMVMCPHCYETVDVGLQMYDLYDTGGNIKLITSNVLCCNCSEELEIEDIEFESEFE
jgi:hypothetical protein